MTSQTILALRFSPRDIRAPLEFADHQILQALFGAALMVRARSGNLQTIGDPVVVLPAALYQRVSRTRWDEEGPATILEYMIANHPGITCEAEPAAGIDCESCSAWETIREVLAQLLPPSEHKIGTSRMVRAVAAEVERLRIEASAHAGVLARLEGQVTAYQEHIHELGQYIVDAHKHGEVDDAAVAILDGYHVGTREVAGGGQGEPGEDTLTAAIRLLRLARERGAYAEQTEVDRLTAELEIERGKVEALSVQMARGFSTQIAEDAANAREDAIDIASRAAIAVLDVLAPLTEGADRAIRVVLNGTDILRVLLPAGTEQAILEEVEAEVADKIDDRLGPDSLVVVHCEPGQPAPGYVIRSGEAHTADPPALRFYWRHESDGQEHEHGPLEEASAIAATWEEFAADAETEELDEEAEDE